MAPPNILLVEDNRVLRRWIRDALEREGFFVESARSAEEAEWLGSCYHFDVLITDWHLSVGKDGFDVLAHVRRKSPNIFAVLISAAADSQLAERAWQAGFQLVLQKPLRLSPIVSAVYARATRSEKEVTHEIP